MADLSLSFYKKYKLNSNNLSSKFLRIFSRIIYLLSTKIIFFHKFLVKLNWIKFNMHALLFWNYFLISNFRYFFVAKLYFIKVIKTVTLFNLYLSVYRALPTYQRFFLFKFHKWFHRGGIKVKRREKIRKQYDMSSYFIKKRGNLKVLKKSRRFNMSLPLRLIPLNNNRNFSGLNYFFYFYFKSVKQRVLISSKFFHFITSFSPTAYVFRYSKMKQFFIPTKISIGYSSKVFYKKITDITVSDIYIFFFRFISLNIKKGYKLFSLNLLKEVFYWSFVERVDLFDLVRHMLFIYTPWVYPRSNIRGKSKPIILDKLRALNLMARWWLDAAIVRRERSMALGLFLELLDIKDNRGLFVSKVKDIADSVLTPYRRRDRKRKLKKIISKRKIKFLSNKKRLSVNYKPRRNLIKRFLFKVKRTVRRKLKVYRLKSFRRSLLFLNSFGFLNFFDRLLLKRIFQHPLSSDLYKKSSRRKKKLFSFFYYINRSRNSSRISLIKESIKEKELIKEPYPFHGLDLNLK